MSFSVEGAFDFLKALEGSDSRVYFDTHNPPRLTIGVGFNIEASTTRDAVLSAMGVVYYDRPNLNANQLAMNLLYNTIVGIITSSGGKSKSTVSSELDHAMADSSADLSQRTFSLNDTQQLDVFKKIVVPEIAEIKGKYAGLIDDNQALALLSLKYNGVKVKGSQLEKDIYAKNQAEAWYQIRYQTNKNKQQGVANRRYVESDKFGLVPASANTYQDAQVFSMLLKPSNLANIEEADRSFLSNALYDHYVFRNGERELIGPYGRGTINTIAQDTQPIIKDLLKKDDTLISIGINKTVGVPTVSGGLTKITNFDYAHMYDVVASDVAGANIQVTSPQAGNYLYLGTGDNQTITGLKNRSDVEIAFGKGVNTLIGGNQVNVLGQDTSNGAFGGNIYKGGSFDNAIFMQGKSNKVVLNTSNIYGINVAFDGDGGNTYYIGTNPEYVVSVSVPAITNMAQFEQWLSKQAFGPIQCVMGNILVVINSHTTDTFVMGGKSYRFKSSANQVVSLSPGSSPKVVQSDYLLLGPNQNGRRFGEAQPTQSYSSFDSIRTLDVSASGQSSAGPVLSGSYAGETFSNLPVNCEVDGLGGGDVFNVLQGVGAISISEADTTANPHNTIAFGPGIDVSALSVSSNGEGDLVISLGAGDSVTLINALSSNSVVAYGVQSFKFNDGTTLGFSQLLQMADIGSATNRTLYGDSSANTFDSKGLATYARGGGGGDTFVFNPGYGTLEIDESDTSDDPQNVLVFGDGIDPSAVSVTGDANGDLVLAISSSDRITIDNALNSADGTTYGVQKVTFADGTVWTYADLLSRAETGSSTTAGIYGDRDPNVLDTQGQTHFSQGGGGGDTFVYHSGYGALLINEADVSAAPDNVLSFGAGIDASSVAVSADASGDLLLNLGGGDLITLQNALNSADGTTYGVQQVGFVDGTTWSFADLVSLAETGSATNTMLYGGTGAETFDSKGVATYERGGGGGDTFIYDRGYGALTIDEHDQGTNPNNVLTFGAGIDPEGVQVTGNAAGDLVLDLGNGDHVTLAGALAASAVDGTVDTPGVQQVTFANGTTWTRADLLAFADTGSATNLSLFGDEGANVFDSKGYATYESGGGGGDSFVYDTGYGGLTINEVDAGSEPDNVLTLGAGIDPASVTITADGQGDVIFSLGGSDVITLKNMVASARAGVQEVRFADGTVWNAAQIVASAGNGTLTVDPTAAEAAIGSAYDAIGSYGVRDIDAGAIAPGTVQAVAIKGYSFSYKVSAIEGSDDILVTDYSGQGIRLVGALADAGAGVPSISFSDGTTWSYAYLEQQLLNAGAWNSPGIFGDSTANTLDPEGLTSLVQGGGGGDTVVYNKGYGAVEINEVDAASNPTNVLNLGSGIAPSDVTVSADYSGDIVLALGGADQITIDNALNSVAGKTFGLQEINFADGTSWDYADLLQKLETPTLEGDGIYGDHQANVLDTQGLVGLAQGGGGGDTFVYNVGYGALEIAETDTSANPTNTLAFGSGIDPSQVSVSFDGNGDILLSLGGSDEITLDNAMNSTSNASYGVQRVTFADGTVWTAAQLIAFANAGAPDNGTLIGTSGADHLDGGGTASYLQGNGGGDTFVYDRGYGAVEINEADTAATPTNVLNFGAGIEPSDVDVSSDGAGNVLLDLGGGDVVTLDNALTSGGGTAWGVQQIEFADGTSWSYSDILTKLETASGAQAILEGTTPGRVLDGGGTATFASGKGGGDTFIYNEGYGQLTISEADQAALPDNVLAFGSDIAPSDVTVSADANGDLILSLDQDDEVILSNALKGGGGTSYGVQSVTFADGTSWSYADLISMVGTGTADSGGVYGDRQANTLDTAGLTDYAQGNGGGDTFVYNHGYGVVEINEADLGSSPNNVLAFGAGIDPAAVAISCDDNGDIVLTLSATDQVVIDNALDSGGGTTWGVQHITFQDGTSWNFADIVASLSAEMSSTVTIGTSAADDIDASGKTFLSGGGGGDTFTYATGDGYVTINEVDSAVSPMNVLEFGSGIDASSVTVSADSAGNLLLTLSASDKVLVKDALNNAGGTTYGVQAVRFADGTSWTFSDLLAKVEHASVAAGGIFGDSGANVLDSQGLTSYARGGGGGDTFVYDRGYGALEIDESDATASPNNTLAFGAGITSSDVSVTSDNNGNLILSLGGADQITVDNALNSGAGSTYGVQHVTFQDGTSWSFADLVAKATVQAAGGIYGDSGANVLDTHGLATYAQGGGGGDTFVYNLRYGQLEIDEADTASAPDNVLAFGEGITAASLTVSGDDDGDLILSLGGSDQVKIDGALTGGDGTTYGVQQVTFADGSSLSYEQLVHVAATGSTTNTTIYGDSGANVLDSKGLAQVAVGNGGGDTFVYNSGYGALEIREQDDAVTPDNVLTFGAGIDPSQVTVTANTDGDLIVALGGSDQVILNQALDSGNGLSYGVQQVVFSDGTIWTYADLLRKAGEASASSSGIYGDAGANVLDTRGLTHFAQGNGGGDTFVYDSGYGALEIDEEDTAATPSNVLAMGPGIGASQVSVTADAAGNLILTLGGGDEITLDGSLNSGNGTTDGVQLVTFSDGTRWSYADLVARADAGTPTNTSLYGDSNGDVFDSRGYATYEHGGGGGDTFVYDRGYGALTIDEASGSGARNVVAFGNGIDPSNITTSVNPTGDIVLDLGAGDVVTLKGAAPGNPAAGVLSVAFANGETWSAAQLEGFATGGVNFAPGSGTLIIDLAADQPDQVPAIVVGAGLLASDFTVSVERADTASLVLTADNGDKIVLKNALTSPAGADQLIRFSDGSTWTYAQMVTAVGTATSDSAGVYGDSAANTLDGKGIATYAQGGGGGDTFVYDSGYGDLEINEVDSGADPTNTLTLGVGIDPSQVTVYGDPSGDLILFFGVGEAVTIDNALDNVPGRSNGVQQVSFADGTVWTYQDLIARASNESNFSGSAYGDASANTLDTHGIAGVYDPDLYQFVGYVQGGGGGDTIAYNAGYGTVEVNEVDHSAAPDNTLAFGYSVNASEISVSALVGGDIVLKVNDGYWWSNDEVILENMLNGDDAHGVQSVTFADGTVWSAADLISKAETGNRYNTVLNGGPGADTFDPAGWARVVQGDGGGDTIVYNPGYGNLQIDEQQASSAPANTLAFGAGIDPNDVTATWNGNDIDLQIGDGYYNDRVVLASALTTGGGQSYGVQSVTFADGTVWTYADMVVAIGQGSANNPSVGGDATANILDTHGYIDPGTGEGYAKGGGGGDAFVFNAGYGVLELNEVDAAAAPNNTLTLGTGIAPSQVSVSGDAAGNIVLDLTGGDRIIIDQGLQSEPGQTFGVQQVVFADGTVWTYQDLLSRVEAPVSGATSIAGDRGANVLDTQGIVGEAIGNGGGDTFVYNQGYGDTTIVENDNAGNPHNKLSFGAGIAESDVTVTADGSGDLLLAVAGSGTITLVGGVQVYAGGAVAGVQQVTFADGTSWSYADLMRRADIGSSDNTILYGDDRPEVFDSRGYATNEYGRSGFDEFLYGAGYGNLTIDEIGAAATPNSVLDMAAGISLSQLTVANDGAGNMILTVAGEGQIEVTGEFAGDGQGIQRVAFANGGSLTESDLQRLSDIGSATNTRLYGTSGADQFDSAGYATYIKGNGGADTFIYKPGYGDLEIDEDAGWSTQHNAELAFGGGIVQADVEARLTQSGDLIITDGTAGDEITVDRFGLDNVNSPYADPYGVDGVSFSDGTSLSQGQLLQLALTATTDNHTIYGTQNDDILPGGPDARFEDGLGGSDTYDYHAGDGVLEIGNDNSNDYSLDTLHFGAGIVQSSLSVRADAAGNIIITDGVAGDSITVDGMAELNYYGYTMGLHQISFSDGSTMTAQQVVALAMIGSPTNTTIYGTAESDLIDGRGYATLENGGGGSDTFVYNPGYGQVEINEISNYYFESTSAILAFGGSLTASDISISFDQAGDVTLQDGVAGDQIVLDNELSYRTLWGWSLTPDGVAEITFSDGSAISQGQLFQDAVTGSATNTRLYGVDRAETFDSKGIATYAHGISGSDTFTYNPNYQALEIDEDAGPANTSQSVLAFGGSIAPSDLVVTATADGAVIIADGIAGDAVTLDNQLNGDPDSGSRYGVNRVTFADGESLSARQLTDLATTGSTTNTSLYGSRGSDTFDSNGFATYAHGGGGDDTYVFDRGYGQLTVDNGSADRGAGGAVAFKSDVSDQDIWFAQSGQDLDVDILGSTDQIVLKNWYASDDSKVATFEAGNLTLDYASIDQLVQAMATFASNNPTFSIAGATSMPNDADLQLAISGTWHS